MVTFMSLLVLSINFIYTNKSQCPHSLTDWLITNSPTSPVDRSLKFGRLIPYSLLTKVKQVSFQKTNRYHLKKKEFSICKYIQLKMLITETHKFSTHIAHHFLILSLIIVWDYNFFPLRKFTLYCWRIKRCVF